MSISAGLVGLPNVGKSTIFNALTKSSVPAENYPFCTIDPHVACTAVPDKRAQELLRIYRSQKIVPATVQFTDIAGLVQGAATGEGLGNQFLSHINQTNLILHVLRCFEDTNVISTQQSIDPISDFEIIVTELMLKDLEIIEKRMAKVEQLRKSTKNSPAQTKELATEQATLERIKQAINAQDSTEVLRIITHTPLSTVPLLCAKNALFIANISEQDIPDDRYTQNRHYQNLVDHFGVERVIPVCAKLEYELSTLPEEEARELAALMGLKHRGLDTIIEKTYAQLGLITFFTCGPKEIHAWPIRAGTTVRAAAGEIHSDLERGFICAEVFASADLFAHGTELKLKELGKIRTEGQDYIVQDGDVLNIRFNI